MLRRFILLLASSGDYSLFSAFPILDFDESACLISLPADLAHLNKLTTINIAGRSLGVPDVSAGIQSLPAGSRSKGGRAVLDLPAVDIDILTRLQRSCSRRLVDRLSLLIDCIAARFRVEGVELCKLRRIESVVTHVPEILRSEIVWQLACGLHVLDYARAAIGEVQFRVCLVAYVVRVANWYDSMPNRRHSRSRSAWIERDRVRVRWRLSWFGSGSAEIKIGGALRIVEEVIVGQATYIQLFLQRGGMTRRAARRTAQTPIDRGGRISIGSDRKGHAARER